MDFEKLVNFLIEKGLVLNYTDHENIRTINAFKSDSKECLVSFDYRKVNNVLTLEKAYCRGKWELTKDDGLEVTTCGDSLVIFSKTSRTCKEVIV